MRVVVTLLAYFDVEPFSAALVERKKPVAITSCVRFSGSFFRHVIPNKSDICTGQRLIALVEDLSVKVDWLPPIVLRVSQLILHVLSNGGGDVRLPRNRGRRLDFRPPWRRRPLR